MKLLQWAKSLTPLGRWMSLALVLGAVLLIWLMMSAWQSRQTARIETRLERNQAGAAIESGRDALSTTSQQAERERAIDDTTRENANAIRSAPGADAPVSVELDAVARERLCRRAAYRQHPDCLQLPAAD